MKFSVFVDNGVKKWLFIVIDNGSGVMLVCSCKRQLVLVAVTTTVNDGVLLVVISGFGGSGFVDSGGWCWVVVVWRLQWRVDSGV